MKNSIAEKIFEEFKKITESNQNLLAQIIQMQNSANFVLTATERKDVSKLVKQVIESLSLSIGSKKKLFRVARNSRINEVINKRKNPKDPKGFQKILRFATPAFILGTKLWFLKKKLLISVIGWLLFSLKNFSEYFNI